MRYRKYSRLFKDAVRAIAPRIQDNGIDEIYVDLTDVHPEADDGVREPTADRWERAHAVARSIKEAVRAATGLSCSIGIAPNKLLAKIASELDKPDGLTLLRRGDDRSGASGRCRARKINGIGPKSSAKLEALGVAHDRGSRRGRSRVARRAFRPRARRVHARCGARPRRARRDHRDGAEVDQPRNDVRARSARRARDREELSRDLHGAVHGREPTTCGARAMSARRSA